MDKGEKVINTYFAVKMKNGEYANDYWGRSSNFTENGTLKSLENAQFMFNQEDAEKMQVIKVTFEVMEEWEK